MDDKGRVGLLVPPEPPHPATDAPHRQAPGPPLPTHPQPASEHPLEPEP